MRILLYITTWKNINHNNCNSKVTPQNYLNLNQIGEKHGDDIKNNVFNKQETLEAFTFIKDYGTFLKAVCQKIN